MKPFSSLGDVFLSLFEKKGWDKGKVLLLLRKGWKEITGDFINRHSRPVFIKGDSLFVEVDNSMLMAEMKLNEETIKMRIKDRFGLNFEKIVFIMGRAEVEKTKRKKTLSPQKIKEIEDMVKGIKDEELRERLKKVILRVEEEKL